MRKTYTTYSFRASIQDLNQRYRDSPDITKKLMTPLSVMGLLNSLCEASPVIVTQFNASGTISNILCVSLYGKVVICNDVDGIGANGNCSTKLTCEGRIDDKYFLNKYAEFYRREPEIQIV